MPAAKASFAILYLRIFPDGGFRTVNKILIVFLFAQAVEEMFVVLFKCKPVVKSWDFTLEGSCLDLQPLFYTAVSGHAQKRWVQVLKGIVAHYLVRLQPSH